MGLSETPSKNYAIVSEYVRNYVPTSVKSAIDPNVTDLSYDSDSTVKSIKQQQKILTEAEIRTVIEKYQTGVSTYELAKEFNCHRSTIGNALKRNGIIVDGHVEGRKYQAKDVIRLYAEEKKSVTEIAKIFGVCDGTIYKCLRRNNIDTHRTRWDYEK